MPGYVMLENEHVVWCNGWIVFVLMGMYRSEIEFESENGEYCLDWTLYDLCGWKCLCNAV